MYLYIRNMAKTTKKDVPRSKKVTSENKATQTVREEKLMIEPEDLTSTGILEIFFSLYWFFLSVTYFSYRLKKKYKKNLLKNINFI